MEFSCQHSTLSLRVCDSLLVFTIFQQGDLDLHKWKMLLSVKIDIFIDTYVGEIMTYLRKIMTQFEQRRGTIFIFKIRQMFERLILNKNFFCGRFEMLSLNSNEIKMDWRKWNILNWSSHCYWCCCSHCRAYQVCPRSLKYDPTSMTSKLASNIQLVTRQSRVKS